MKFQMDYDLASYIKSLSSDLSDKRLTQIKRELVFALDVIFAKKLENIVLPEAVSESCALVNLSHHFRELVKNSVDVLVSRFLNPKLNCQQTILNIEIQVEYNDERVVVSYRDNGPGFSEIMSGEFLPYQDTQYSSTSGSKKVNDKTQLGGAGKGLKMLARSLELAEADFLLGTHEKGGAVIKISSSNKPYTLPIRYDQQANELAKAPELQLPKFILNRSSKGISMAKLHSQKSYQGPGFFNSAVEEKIVPEPVVNKSRGYSI